MTSPLEAIAPTRPENYFNLDVRFAEFDPPDNQDEFRRYMDQLPEDIHIGSRAQLRTYHEWQYHPEKGRSRPLSSIRSLGDLADFAFPELSNPVRHAGLTKQVRRWHTRGLAVAGSPPHLGGELFEAAWRLRGFENFMIDLVQRPHLAAYLLDQLTSMLIENALILARAGVDILLLDDDVAMPNRLMIGPDTWRRIFQASSGQSDHSGAGRIAAPFGILSLRRQLHPAYSRSGGYRRQCHQPGAA